MQAPQPPESPQNTVTFTVPSHQLEDKVGWFNARGYTVISATTNEKITTLVLKGPILGKQTSS